MKRRYRLKEQQLKNEINHTMVNKFQRMCDFREIQTLYQVINDDEHIIQAVNGLLPGNNNGTGLVILTNKRIILYNHGLFLSNDSPSIPFDKINKVTPHCHIIYGHIDFDDGADTTTVAHIFRWKCPKFVQAINNAMTAEKKKQEKMQSNNNSNVHVEAKDPVKELQELNDMKNNNQIDEQDYNTLKHKIIND